jgi:hypothetical protein
MYPRLATIAALAMTAALRPPSAALAQDSAGVRAAALDYIEGFYTGDSTRLVRSVRPEVYKYGFWRHRDSTSYNAGTQMTWEGFHRYANGVRERGGRGAPANAPKDVRIFEVLDKTASAKITAWWGIDYLLMGKFDGRWMITHVLWQSPPRSSGSP